MKKTCQYPGCDAPLTGRAIKFCDEHKRAGYRIKIKQYRASGKRKLVDRYKQRIKINGPRDTVRSLTEVAETLGTSVQNIAMLELNGMRKFKQAWQRMFPDLPNPVR